MELGQDKNPVDLGVETVAYGDIDESVLPAKGTAGFDRNLVKG